MCVTRHSVARHRCASVCTWRRMGRTAGLIERIELSDKALDVGDVDVPAIQGKWATREYGVVGRDVGDVNVLEAGKHPDHKLEAVDSLAINICARP